MDEYIPAHKRALGIWIRAWQLAGGEWPPRSRAITHQIVVMLKNHLLDAGRGRLTEADAFELARETLAPLTAQKFYPGSEQDIAVKRITDAILEAERGDTEP